MTGSFRIRAAFLLLAPLAAAGCLDVTPFTYSTVRVQVNDQAGAGLASVHVVLYTTGRVVDDQRTDTGGRATFIRVPLGNFGIGVEPPAGYLIPPGGSDHTDAIRIGGGTDTTVTFVFDRACCGGSQVRVANARRGAAEMATVAMGRPAEGAQPRRDPAAVRTAGGAEPGGGDGAGGRVERSAGRWARPGRLAGSLP